MASGTAVLALCGFALLSALEAAHAGAWTLPRGTGEVIVSGLYSEALATFGSGGDIQPVPVFQKVELGAFGAYGLTDWLTATARTELRSEASGVPVVLDEARFGLSGLGGRIRLWEGEGGVLSSEFSVAVPTGRAARRWEGDPDAEIDLRLLAGYGRALGSWTGFVDVEGAYRLRPGAPNDEIRADVTLGLRPRPRLLWLAQSFNTFGTGGRDEAGRREHKAAVSVVYDLTKSVSVQLGSIATVAGRDALQERGFISALWIRF